MVIYKLVISIFLSLLVSISAIGQSQDGAFIDFGSIYFEEGEEKLLDGELLSGSMKIDFNSSGDLYLLDLRLNKVHVYDNNLKLKFSFGAEGKGPGEFERASDMYIDENDNVYIIDSALQRVNKFSPKGEFLEVRSFNFRAIDMVTINDLICLHAGGVVAKDLQTVKCYNFESGEYAKKLIDPSEVIGKRPLGFANSTFDMIQKGENHIVVLQHPLDATITVFDNKLAQVNKFVVENEVYKLPEFPRSFNPFEHKVEDYLQSTSSVRLKVEEPQLVTGLGVEFGE